MAAGAATAGVAHNAGRGRAEQNACNEQATEAYAATQQAAPAAVPLSTREALAEELRARDEVFDALLVVVGPVEIVEDRGYAEWTATATHAGPIDLDGDGVIDATGATVEIRGVTVAEFDGDNRIVALRQYRDELAMLEGLGLLPDD